LIEEAAAPASGELAVPVTGDLRKDLGRFIRAYERAFSSPAARAAIPALLSIYQHGSTQRKAQDWIHLSVRPNFYEILSAAGTDSVDPSVDPDDVFDLLLGALLARALIPTVRGRNRSVERTVDLVERTLRPLGTTLPSRAKATDTTRG
jgi:hypothetical protein